MRLDDIGQMTSLAFAHGVRRSFQNYGTNTSPSLAIKGVAGSEFVNGWEKAGGGGGGGERAGEIQPAGADVTEASQKRKWLQKRGIEGTVRFPGLSTMGSDAQLRRCANPPGPGMVKLSNAGPTWV